MKHTALLLALLSTSVTAQDRLPEIAIHSGVFEVLESSHATELGLEYRGRPKASLFNLSPAVGITANTDGGYWAHAGLRYDYFLSKRWVVTPALAISGV